MHREGLLSSGTGAKLVPFPGSARAAPQSGTPCPGPRWGSKAGQGSPGGAQGPPPPRVNVCSGLKLKVSGQRRSETGKGRSALEGGQAPGEPHDPNACTPGARRCCWSRHAGCWPPSSWRGPGRPCRHWPKAAAPVPTTAPATRKASLRVRGGGHAAARPLPKLVVPGAVGQCRL